MMRPIAPCLPIVAAALLASGCFEVTRSFITRPVDVPDMANGTYQRLMRTTRRELDVLTPAQRARCVAVQQTTDEYCDVQVSNGKPASLRTLHRESKGIYGYADPKPRRFRTEHIEDNVYLVQGDPGPEERDPVYALALIRTRGRLIETFVPECKEIAPPAIAATEEDGVCRLNDIAPIRRALEEFAKRVAAGSIDPTDVDRLVRE